MRYFLDIGIVQIQTWLMRTQKLQGLRGGSTLISQASDPGEIEKLLERRALLGPVTINKEAGQIDGVIALELHDDGDNTSEAVEKAVVGHVRDKIPGASLSVTRYRGETYDRARSNKPFWTREWPAPAADWPPGKLCKWCSTWPARPDDFEGDALCSECAARKDAAGKATSRIRVPYPEQELLRRLRDEEHTASELAIPDEFEPLAKLDGVASTHLALVYADGNAVGAFIRDVFGARGEHDAPVKFELAKTISEATWGALVAAVAKVHMTHDRLLPIVPHLVGGDDVLVSVPAARAWQFTETLLAGFSERIATATEGLGVSRLPSLSAGMVFHHYTEPLFMLSEMGKRLLRAAKVHTRGNAASVAWQDTTRDGHELTNPAVLRHETLVEMRDALTGLADLPPSARHRLEDLLRAHGPDSGELAAHRSRLDISDKLAPFGEGSVRLADALGMVRWWPRCK